MHLIVSALVDAVSITPVDDSGAIGGATIVSRAGFGDAVRAHEAARPRWVWDDTNNWYPALLAAGVRVDRCHDLRLCRAILRNTHASGAFSPSELPLDAWDAAPQEAVAAPAGAALFEFDDHEAAASAPDPLTEFQRQQAATTPRLALLLAAESAGALVAVEIRHAGLPWRAEIHNDLLTRTLGPRPRLGDRPVEMERLAREVREALDAPDLNPDSAAATLKALRRAGLMVNSTSKWELSEVNHPAIAPLLEYKRLARLMSANGWHWLDTNVRDGRFYPDYVPGGVVTGRWSSRGGGGALQLPRQIRAAVVADPGWKLIVADASQLEPRILAAIAADRAMAAAGASGDLYAGIVQVGAVTTRDEAKVAMLGAMYGATTGESGRLLPRLARAFPRALGLVEDAARSGERGDPVATWLGRTSPVPASDWHDAQSLASADGASAAAQDRARGAARSWGRFTRNFVVQGTAAEWALAWMAFIRSRLHALGGESPLMESPHLAFFLHDEVVIHAPAEHAAAVDALVRDSAEAAGQLLFADFPVTFPLTVAVVDNYGEAK
ncbi:bifunctional 3'-5' exonuclease/DNA polymerase [Homoserinimonas hongtaonis]|uniref:DNA-directed DNA polymerase n=1 Tax=Homoserinimonas hongtaonis TaxID=2079791 RepID=A0A2U1T3D0_9MICO|nr:bifunctional 3'-5' exonuclease/DNA polymerase [Salinibacterium hongtaonis]PWB98394.1 bifunctional 3'-5' exonuclease/DNA polymerase [Salinibacterium hongtaonis]